MTGFAVITLAPLENVTVQFDTGPENKPVILSVPVELYHK